MPRQKQLAAAIPSETLAFISPFVEVYIPSVFSLHEILETSALPYPSSVLFYLQHWIQPKFSSEMNIEEVEITTDGHYEKYLALVWPDTF